MGEHRIRAKETRPSPRNKIEEQTRMRRAKSSLIYQEESVHSKPVFIKISDETWKQLSNTPYFISNIGNIMAHGKRVTPILQNNDWVIRVKHLGIMRTVSVAKILSIAFPTSLEEDTGGD